MKLVIFICAFCSAFASSFQQPLSEIVLFGPYSNLAAKYLWQSLFTIWDAALPAKLRVVAAGRDPLDAGTAKIWNMIARNTTCGSGLPVEGETCQRMKEAFRADIRYVQIRDAAGYANLGLALNESSSDPSFVGRVTYFSVDTSLVPGMLRLLRVHGGVRLGAHSPSAKAAGKQAPFSRVVVEKPLGNDGPSCRALLRALQSELGVTKVVESAPAGAEEGPAGTEDEGQQQEGRSKDKDVLLIMDHYLGKTGLRLAYEVRQRITHSVPWVSYLSEGLGHMEVVVTEEETAEGRTGFYNGVGVLRDMLQSHVSLFMAAAIGPPKSAWNADHRLKAYSRLQPKAIAASFKPYHNVGATTSVQEEKEDENNINKWKHVSASARVVQRNATEAVTHTIRLARYNGYLDHVARDRAPGGSGAFAHNVTHARWCHLEQVRSKALKRAPPASCVESQGADSTGTGAGSMGPYDWYGPGYRAITGMDLQLVVGQGTLMDVKISKAAGFRTAYFRHTVRNDRLSPCGPVTITFHMQGRVMLPPGINMTDIEDSDLPHNSPAVIFTGICKGGASPPMQSILDNEALGWPDDWKQHRVPSAGLWWTVPDIDAWKAAWPTIASRTVDETYALEGLLARFYKVSVTPGRAGGDAYTGMIAAALAGETDGYLTPKEARVLWDVWQGVISISDAAAAGPAIGHALELLAAKRSVNESKGDYQVTPAVLSPPDDPLTGPGVPPQVVQSFVRKFKLPALPSVLSHAVGDASWMRLLKGESTVGPTIHAVHTDARGHVVDKFAAAVISLVWSSTRVQSGLDALGGGMTVKGTKDRPAAAAGVRAPHIAFDYPVDGGSPELDVLYERLAEDDVCSLVPWSEVHAWPVRLQVGVGAGKVPAGGAGSRGSLRKSLLRPLDLLGEQYHAPVGSASAADAAATLNAETREEWEEGSLDGVVLAWPGILEGERIAEYRARLQAGAHGSSSESSSSYVMYTDSPVPSGQDLHQAAVSVLTLSQQAVGKARSMLIVLPKPVWDLYSAAEAQGSSVSAQVAPGGAVQTALGGDQGLPTLLVHDVQQTTGRIDRVQLYIV